MGKRVAVVGAGMTKFVRRAQETGPELCWAAASQALESAGMSFDDIDCVIHGTAPDAFDGVHMKGEYLAGGSGAWRKPYTRTYVGGGTGVYAPIHAWKHLASGKFRTALVVCEEKMSSCQPHPQGAFITIFDHTTERALGPNLLWIFALEQQRYMAVHGITNEEIARVAVKNKHNAMGHPAAQLGAELTVDEVLSSEILAYPVHRLMVSPTSDGAAAVVMTNEDVAKSVTDQPVWLDGVGWALDTAFWTNRDLYYPRYVEKAAWMAYNMAGIKNPAEEISFAEPYDPFCYKELHHLEGLQLAPKGQAPKLLAEGHFDRDGKLPSCPSGGLLGVGNPIAAAGMMKICELFWQLRGEAGERQIKKDLRWGVAQAWGDLMQVGTVVVMGRDG
jgi:acetyl-CoA C-acetyltransferase